MPCCWSCLRECYDAWLVVDCTDPHRFETRPYFLIA